MEFDLVRIIIVIGVVLLSMTLHEAMHAFVGYWLGDDTAKLQGRLTLNPIKHIDPFLTLILPITLAIIGAPIFGGARPVPFNPSRLRYDEWGSAMVAAAGPLTNFLLAFVAFALYVLFGQPQTGIWSEVLTLAVTVNLGFFVFNILPIPPLDGSRVLYALAPEFVRRGMEFVEQFGVFFVFAVVLLASGPIGTFMTAAIQFFLQLFAHAFGLGVA
ncbi:MAG TPA: site-2 protease family protein [Candidatus Saccharimonadales bacterium]|nr:site-2 protease family protein [Candidatus Saccharimonadales bacterium]